MNNESNFYTNWKGFKTYIEPPNNKSFEDYSLNYYKNEIELKKHRIKELQEKFETVSREKAELVFKLEEFNQNRMTSVKKLEILELENSLMKKRFEEREKNLLDVINNLEKQQDKYDKYSCLKEKNSNYKEVLNLLISFVNNLYSSVNFILTADDSINLDNSHTKFYSDSFNLKMLTNNYAEFKLKLAQLESHITSLMTRRRISTTITSNSNHNYNSSIKLEKRKKRQDDINNLSTSCVNAYGDAKTNLNNCFTNNTSGNNNEVSLIQSDPHSEIYKQIDKLYIENMKMRKQINELIKTKDAAGISGKDDENDFREIDSKIYTLTEKLKEIEKEKNILKNRSRSRKKHARPLSNSVNSTSFSYTPSRSYIGNSRSKSPLPMKLHIKTKCFKHC